MREEKPALHLPPWNELPDIGLYMDQVVTLMERALPPARITRSMVNNYVKAGLIKRPAGKKYDREQLSTLLEIGVLKQALSLEEIAAALALLNGRGVQRGYEAFRALLHEALEGLVQGRIGFDPSAEDAAVRTGVLAAACVMRARGMLSCGKLDKN